MMNKAGYENMNWYEYSDLMNKKRIEVEDKALELARQFKPDLSQFDCGRGFSEMYYANETFYQMYFYDRLDSYTDIRTQYLVSPDKVEPFKKAFHEFNEKLKQTLISLAKEMLPEDEQSSILKYARVGDEIGFCFLGVHERNKEKEEETTRQQREYERENPQEAPSCSRCGDGGCPNCVPHRFI